MLGTLDGLVQVNTKPCNPCTDVDHATNFFSLSHSPATHECPQKNSAQSVQPFGRLSTTYIYTNVLFYYIDYLSILYLFYTILFELKNNNIYPNPINNSYFENSGFVFRFLRKMMNIL